MCEYVSQSKCHSLSVIVIVVCHSHVFYHARAHQLHRCFTICEIQRVNKIGVLDRIETDQLTELGFVCVNEMLLSWVMVRWRCRLDKTLGV